MSEPKTILCLSSFEKGHAFLREAKRLGWRVFLLTSKTLEHAPWPRESIDEIFFVPDQECIWKRDDVLLGASFLARTQRIHHIVALDDYDVETAAALREHLRVPGMGDTTARYFRDKLAMRVKARESGVPVPEFSPILNYDDLRDFMRDVPGPWLLKPRFEASALGIRKIERAEELWPALDELGDRQSFHLLERFVPGEVFHVDSIVSEREIVFAIACRYGAPPMQVAHGGGIFSSRTLEYGSADEQQLLAANRVVLPAMGYLRGVSHTEFIKAHDGTIHFLETSARAGGANLMEMIEAATGLNLWAEWAKVELQKADYRVGEARRDYAGVLVSLARQEWPDLRVFNDPEVVLRIPRAHHVGLVWRSESLARVEELQRRYIERVRHDFHASAPLPPRATQ
jgi:biotin carboxylase